MRIPGWFFFIVGVFMAGYSAFVNYMTGEGAMKIFLYVGGFLIFVGIVKMIFSRPSPRKIMMMQQRAMRMNPRQTAVANKQLGVGVCPRCRSRNYYYARFCHMCGYRLR